MMIHPKSGFGAILATALVLTGELPSGRIPHFSANSTTQIPRDTAAQKPGTATIRGRVVGVVDGLLSPIRSARVTLGSGPTTVEPVFTDDEGRFALSNLAAGRYTLTAEKTGFVKTRYGSRNEFDPPMPLDVADGAVVEGIEIGLPKGAAIIGRIVDELGDPVVAVPVSVGFVQVIGSETRFVPIARPASDTNDRGDYRIGGLPAGRYYVSVAGVTEGATIFGAPSEWARTMNWGRTFFQSAPSLSGATAIVLGPGEERSGIDITLTPSRPAKLTITLTDADGAPVEGMVNLMMVDDSLGTVTRNMASPFPPPNPTVPLPPRIVTLDPGEWIGVGFAGNSREVGVVKRFSLTSGEETSITFSPITGARITGQVVFEGAAAPASAENLRVTTRPTGPAAGASPIPRVNAPVAADGGFELKNVFGTVDLQLASPVPGWTVGAVMHGDRDLLDAPLTLNGGEDIRDVRVILNSQLGRLAGVTLTADGRPSPGCVVALFPDGERPLSARRSRLQRSDQNGRFVMADLVPGTYLAAAATDIDAPGWLTRDYLQHLQPGAARVSITVGGSDSVTLACLAGTP